MVKICGIYGAVGKVIDSSKLYHLGLLAQERGKDASGFWTPQIGIIKHPLPSKEFLKAVKPLWEFIPEQKVFIGHTRWASHGSPKNNHNNHPLEGKKYILVHNGIVYMKKLKKYHYKGQTDSEIILSYLERKGLDGLKSIDGSAALVWVEKKNPFTIYLWRHTNPLAIGGNGKTVYFASNLRWLKQIFGKSKHWVVDLMSHRLVKITITNSGVTTTFLNRIKPKRERRRIFTSYMGGLDWSGFYANPQVRNPYQRNLDFVEDEDTPDEEIPKEDLEITTGNKLEKEYWQRWADEQAIEDKEIDKDFSEKYL